MNEKSQKYTCLIVLALLAFLALNPTWAGGEDYQATIRIIGDDYRLDDADVSGLETGDSKSFYTEDGREVLITRNEHGFDISVDGETLDIPQFSHGEHSGSHGIRIIRESRRCADDTDCEDMLINIHEDSDHEIILDGQDNGEFAFVQDGACEAGADCRHVVKIWQGGDGDVIELLDDSIIDAADLEDHKVIIIERQNKALEGEEI